MERLAASTFQWITLAIAASGFGLGVFNAIVMYRRGVERLHIGAKFHAPTDDVSPREPWLLVHIGNRGNHSVTIADILLRNGRTGEEYQINFFKDPDVKWPGVVEAGGLYELRLIRGNLARQLGVADPIVSGIDTLIVKTATGHKHKHQSAELLEFVTASRR